MKAVLIVLVIAGCGSISAKSDAGGGDDGGGTGSDAAGSGEDQTLAITNVDPALLAHGSRVTITGTGFVGITSVNIAGQALIPASMSATKIVIDPLPDATLTGARQLLVQRGSETVMSTVNVARLVLDEIDPQPDTHEFIELQATGTPNVAISGYVLVAFDDVSQRSVGAIDIAGTVSSDELVLMRGPGVTPQGAIPTASIIDYPAAFLPNVQAGVAIYQGSVADFPLGTQVSNAKLIDAVVYSTIDGTPPTPCALLLTLYGPGKTCVIDEASGDDSNLQVMGRCGGGGVRRQPLSWKVINGALGTPGAPNNCTNLDAFACTSPTCP